MYVPPTAKKRERDSRSAIARTVPPIIGQGVAWLPGSVQRPEGERAGREQETHAARPVR